MRLLGTLLLIVCGISPLMGCCHKHHRHWCPFSHHRRCVDRDQWDCDDACDGGWDDDDDDDDDHDRRHHQRGRGCPCDSYGMASWTSDCGCSMGGGMMYEGGMYGSYDGVQPTFAMPQSSGCSCGSSGMDPSMMLQPTPMPTSTMQYPSMMMQPVTMQPPLSEPTPAPGQFYDPRPSGPTPASTTVSPRPPASQPITSVPGSF